MSNANMNYETRKLRGLALFAAADKSDPFTYTRGTAHIRNGIVGYTENGGDAFYEAEEMQETRKLPDGREYFATVYKNMKRP